jgi:VWFA-related protein
MRPPVVALLCVLAISSSSPAQSHTDASKLDQAPVIRATTRLVQISVVVQDKKGNPVTGLTQEDFSILDQGKPQKIAFFSSVVPLPNSPPQSLPPNVFTNRFDLKGQEPGAVSVVLFDALNTSTQDQSFVRQQILRVLQTLKPHDHVALYALTNNLIIMHDFTEDASALVDAARHFTAHEIASFDKSNPDTFHVPELASDPSWAQFEAAVNAAQARIAEQATLDRAETTAAAFQAIADHVATIPGRKTLVWISGGIPREFGQFGHYDLGSSDSSPVAKKVKHAIDALNGVNMAIYAIDAHGVALEPGMSPQSRGGLDSQFHAILPSEQNMRETFTMLADTTGGRAYFGNNDVGQLVKRALDDGRDAYTVGYYPDHGTWDGRFREIKVKVKPEGVQLRYRKGYYAFASQPEDDKTVKADLNDAAISPLDSTTLGMIVSGKTVGEISARKIELHVGLDPKQMLFENTQDKRKGSVDLFFVQRDASGKMLAAEKQHVELNFPEKQYEYLSRTAMVLDRHLTAEPQASEIRIVVRDAGSGALGSVTVPVNSILQTENLPAKAAVKSN